MTAVLRDITGNLSPGIKSGLGTTVIGVYANLAALAAVNAANYPVGSIAMVGPDSYGQYARWYSNGIRWRPHSATIFQNTTPAILTDTTTTETDVLSYTLPKELVGPNDIITVNYLWAWTNNATNKTPRVYIAGSKVMEQITASGAGFRGSSWLEFRDSKASQGCPNGILGIAYTDGGPGSSGGIQTNTVDVNTTDVVIRASAQWGAGGSGTNNITLHRFSARLEFVS